MYGDTFNLMVWKNEVNHWIFQVNSNELIFEMKPIIWIVWYAAKSINLSIISPPL